MPLSNFLQAQPRFTPHLALRITNTQIQLAQSSSNLSLKTFTTVNLPPGIIDHGLIKNSEAFDQQLTELLKKLSHDHQYITLGIPEDSAFIKVVELKNVNQAEISDAISWQADDLLPLPPDKMYYDWLAIPNSSQILIAALPKQLVDQIIDLFNKHHLKVLDVETTSLTLFRLAQTTPDLDPTKPLVLIDAEPTITSLVLEPPASIIVTSITPPDKSGQPDLKNAQSQLLQMINYYQKKSNKAITSIYLTGQYASHLQNHPLLDLPHQLFPLPQGASDKFFPQQISATLANKPLAPPQDSTSINLLPPLVQHLYNQAQSHQLIRQLSIISSIALIIINALLAYPLITLTRTPNLQTPPSEQSELPIDIAMNTKQLSQKVSLTNRLLEKQLLLTPTLNQLTSIISSPLIPSSFNFDLQKQTFSIYGFAPTRDQLVNLRNRLTEHEQFSDIKLPFPDLEKPQDINFSISGTYTPIARELP